MAINKKNQPMSPLPPPPPQAQPLPPIRLTQAGQLQAAQVQARSTQGAQPAQAVSPGQAAGTGEQQLKLFVAPDLEYHYRDFFSIHIGFEEVVLELGNRHRSTPDQVTVSNRVVFSIPNAFRLQQALSQGLLAAQQRMQQQMQQGGAAGAATPPPPGPART
jgi:hypothetical protein